MDNNRQLCQHLSQTLAANAQSRSKWQPLSFYRPQRMRALLTQAAAAHIEDMAVAQHMLSHQSSGGGILAHKCPSMQYSIYTVASTPDAVPATVQLQSRAFPGWCSQLNDCQVLLEPAPRNLTWPRYLSTASSAIGKPHRLRVFSQHYTHAS